VRVALITGISGQDGGYLAEQLLAEGSVVHGTVQPGQLVPGHLLALGKAVELHEVDLRDPRALPRLVARCRPGEVYNLAGISSVAQSWVEPVLTAEINGTAFAGLLQALRDEQERSGRQIRLLQASSAEIFAGTTASPQDELTPVMPRSPYGASKAFAQYLCDTYRSFGLHATAVILYNHESPRRPRSFVTRKITSTVAAIARGEADQLVLGSLEPRRDWGWAPEYVDAMVRALRHQDPSNFILATGISHSVAEFVQAAFNRIGVSDWRRYVLTDPLHARASDAMSLVGDARRARDLLGWTPNVTFEEVVVRMVDADLAGHSTT
jgi:GDPmannose 4,6-dehydratase